MLWFLLLSLLLKSDYIFSEAEILALQVKLEAEKNIKPDKKDACIQVSAVVCKKNKSKSNLHVNNLLIQLQLNYLICVKILVNLLVIIHYAIFRWQIYEISNVTKIKKENCKREPFC